MTHHLAVRARLNGIASLRLALAHLQQEAGADQRDCGAEQALLGQRRDGVEAEDGQRVSLTPSVAETVSVAADPSPPPRVASACVARGSVIPAQKAVGSITANASEAVELLNARRINPTEGPAA